MKRAFILALLLSACGPAEVRVIDGDTFVRNGEKIRLIDIDAPEMDGKCAYERSLARMAKRRLAQLLPFTREIDRGGEDRYGRTLALVTVRIHEDKSAGQMLVEEGLARPWTGRREPWCNAEEMTR